MVGLALAAAGAAVTISDVPSLLPLLQLNVALQEGGGASPPRLTATALDWGEPPPPALLAAPPFDTVVGCDLLYDCVDQGALLQMVRRFVGPGGELLLAVNKRDQLVGLQSFVGLLRGCGFAVETEEVGGGEMLRAWLELK